MDIKTQNLALKSILANANKNMHTSAVEKQKDSDEKTAVDILKDLDLL